MTKVVDVPFTKLRTVHHLSDIHVRNLKRHNEYREVFERVYNEIKKDSEDSIIYVGGDIAHAKLDMSPELVDLISEFFKNLADIAPTVIIAGNHDCNLNNLHRLDVIQPIVKNLNHPNIHYWRDTGVFKLAGVTFTVMSVFDEHTPEKYPLAVDIEGDTKIALFHGTVNNSSTDFGFHLPSDVKIEIFDGYDLALLGDIHKKQFLNKEKTVAYCGSLIQQNHGEALEHGYLKWDIPTRTSEFIKIDNDYGFYTLNVDNGVVPMVDDMPTKARLRVRISNTDSSMIKKVTSTIHKTYNIKDIVINRTDTLSKSKTGDRTNKIDIGDIRDYDYQYNLISDYLGRNFAVDDSVLLKIKSINEDINLRLPEDEISRNVNWKLKTFEFDNMFSYGTNNFIDFSNINGMAGLFASNASGKSSLLDAITYCLFDTCSRTIFGKDVLNNKKTWFTCRLNFEINGQDYWVERRAKKKRNGHVKVDVDFWTIDDVGDKLSLNGDQRRTTNLSIRKVIGDYNDFILTALSLQTNGTVFIDKTQKERKEILAQFMDLNIFDKLYTVANEEIHDVSSLLKSLKKENYGKELADAEISLEESNVEYEEIDLVKNDIIDEQKKYNAELILLNQKLKPVDSTIIDIEHLENESLELNSKLDDIDIKIDVVSENIIHFEQQLDESNEILNSFNENEIVKKYQSKIDKTKQIEIVENQLELLKSEVKFKLDKVHKLDKHEYDPNCDYCVKNPFVVDAMKTKEELDGDKVTVKNLLDKHTSIEDEIKKMGDVEKEQADLENIKKDVELFKNKQHNYNLEKIGLVSQKSNLETQIETVDDKIVKYYENEETINSNKEIQEKIDVVNSELQVISEKLDGANQKLNILYGQIKVYESKIIDVTKQIKKIKDLETKYEAYEYYLDAVKRDGVPYELISKALPQIETEVNNILDQIVDFNIVLQMDGKNINTIISYDDDNFWPLELSSGMERFITALALRVALISISNLPRPDFLAIDEGFGVLDSDNLNSLAMLFDYLKTQFRFLMVISHIDAMKDIMDTLIEIKKEKGYSSVNYN